MIEAFFLKLINQKPLRRKLILAIFDIANIFVSLFIVILYFSDSLSNYSLISNQFIFTLLITLLSVYSLTGQYKAITRFSSTRTFYYITFRNFIIFIILCFFKTFIFKGFPDNKYIGLLLFIITFCSLSYRLILSDILNSLFHSKKIKKENIVIYGAGSAGLELYNSLKLNRNLSIHSFIDDKKTLWGRSIDNLNIYPVERLENFKDQIDKILIAIPSINKDEKIVLLNKIQKYNIKVFQIPSLENIINGSSKISDIEPINIEDLLYRKRVEPDNELLNKSIKGKVVCVTGAGGSIGSELCKQITQLNPLKIVLIDNHEYSLYKIDNEIKALLDKDELKINTNIQVLPLLGNLLDKNFILNVFKNHNINIVFHSAAYKHVPLVESNPIQGLTNNLLSTKFVCEAAEIFNIEKLVLISSDKAVRPTNVMGASKRLSELIIQDFALRIEQSSEKTTKFSMVRFGNVLGSSGSVVPLFLKQIKEGGPITITHPKMTRYFMTIKEAAELVIQSSSLSKGGDLFLLDMGQPVKIYELAKKMIQLSGSQIKSDQNPNGDIEIIFTGKRPGEKIYEELLIDAKAENTSHPLILRAKEKLIETDLLWQIINQMEEALISQDKEQALALLSKLVPEWCTTIKKKNLSAGF